MAKAAEILWWLGLLGSSEVKIAGVILFSLFFFFPMEENSSQGATSWHLIWHAGTQISSGVESWGQTHVELLQCLGPQAQVHL